MTRRLKDIYIGTSFLPAKDRLLEFDKKGNLQADATKEEIDSISRFLAPEVTTTTVPATTKPTTTKPKTTKKGE